MRRIELHRATDGGATALTASGVHRFDRDQVTDLFKLLAIRPTEKNLQAWLAERPRGIASLLYPEYSHKPRAHRFSGCKVCDHRMRDQIEIAIDREHSQRSVAGRYGVPIADLREHRRRGQRNPVCLTEEGAVKNHDSAHTRGRSTRAPSG